MKSLSLLVLAGSLASGCIIHFEPDPAILAPQYQINYPVDLDTTIADTTNLNIGWDSTPVYYHCSEECNHVAMDDKEDIPRVDPSPTPEPSSYLLAGTVLALVAIGLRKLNRA